MNARSAKPVSLVKVVVATSVGNALEWFDIIVYGFFAVYIARNFFPASNDTASLLLTYGTFGASYLVRPIGGMVIGAYADKHGRKAALTLSVALMTVGTALIALMPNYAQIGLLAPIGIFCARLIQGFSAGGEFGPSTAMLIEHAPHRRGFLASWQFATQGLATLLASAFGFGVATYMSAADLSAWGWRLPFFFGLLIGPVGLYLRAVLEDAAEFTESAHNTAPLKQVFTLQKRLVLISIGALTVSTSISYLLQYIPTFAIRELHLSSSTGFAATMVGGVILSVVTPFAGHLSDRIGRRKQMTVVGVLLAATAYPAFRFAVEHASLVTLFALVAWLSLLKSVYFGALPALMAEIFPTETRATGMSVAYNIGVTVFGGFTPVIVIALVSVTHDKGAPGLYVILTSVISLVALAAAGKARVWTRREESARPYEGLIGKNGAS